MDTTNWKRFGIGRRFEKAELAQVDPQHFDVVHRYAKRHLALLAAGRGLLLSGPVGIGKSYATTALMKYLRQHMGSRFDFLFVTAPEMFDQMTGRQKDPFRGKPWLDVYTSVNALVINDLGKEDRSRPGKARDVLVKLGRILRNRHEENLPVFITTNVPLVAPATAPERSTFETIYGTDLWSLLYDMTESRAQIVAPDRRRLLVPDLDAEETL